MDDDSTSAWTELSNPAAPLTVLTSLVKAACPAAWLQILPPTMALICFSATLRQPAAQRIAAPSGARRSAANGTPEQNDRDDRNRGRERPSDNGADATASGRILIEPQTARD